MGGTHDPIRKFAFHRISKHAAQYLAFDWMIWLKKLDTLNHSMQVA